MSRMVFFIYLKKKFQPIYVEPKDKQTFNAAMLDYYAKINDPNCKGAIFMAVCRGKVSEGLDFADANGRAVFIIGLPYPPLKDPKVVLKKKYIDGNSKNKDLTSGRWYRLEATRAVNQAIGRVIRHRNDYGAIILLDDKFNDNLVQNEMSLWLRKHIKITSFQEAIRDVREFFRVAQGKFGKVTKGKTQEVLKVVRSSGFSFNSCGSSSSTQQTGLVNINKRKADSSVDKLKKKKITVVANVSKETSMETSMKEFIYMVAVVLAAHVYYYFYYL